MAKRILREFKIDEISSVDRPAQQPAVKVIMKRQDIEKMYENAVITDPDDTGHSHLLFIEGRAGETSYARGEGEDMGHDHPFMVNTDGTITIGEQLGHTHKVSSPDIINILTTLASSKILARDIDGEAMVALKQYSTEERENAINKKESLPDGSYVIKNELDLSSAIKVVKKDEINVAQHIASRADALGLTKKLPDTELFKLAIQKNTAVDGGLKSENNMSQTKKAAESSAGDETNVMDVEGLKKAQDDLEAANNLLEETNKSLDEAKATIAKTESLATMNDVQKAHYDTLEGEVADVFLEKSFDERQEALTELSKANKVIYKSLDGTEYRANDDDRLVKLAKRADEDHKALQKSLLEKKELELTKRAEDELSNLPGKVETHVSLLKAIDSIKDDTEREESLKVLKAHNAAMSGAFETVGSSVISKGKEGGDPVAEMDELAKSYAKEHDMEYYDAYDAVGKKEPELLQKAITHKQVI